MEQKIDGVIYLCRNKKNGMVYVGQTREFKRRMQRHKWGKDGTYFDRVYHAHYDDFEVKIIDRASTIEQLNLKERFWIEFYNSYKPNGYNIFEGGRGYLRDEETRQKYAERSTGRKHTEETKLKLREMRLGEKNPFYGKHHTEEHIKKISKPVICVETGVVYESGKKASLQMGKDRTAVNKAIKNNQRCGGYHWKYYEEEYDEDC